MSSCQADPLKGDRAHPPTLPEAPECSEALQLLSRTKGFSFVGYRFKSGQIIRNVKLMWERPLVLKKVVITN